MSLTAVALNLYFELFLVIHPASATHTGRHAEQHHPCAVRFAKRSEAGRQETGEEREEGGAREAAVGVCVAHQRFRDTQDGSDVASRRVQAHNGGKPRSCILRTSFSRVVTVTLWCRSLTPDINEHAEEGAPGARFGTCVPLSPCECAADGNLDP